MKASIPYLRERDWDTEIFFESGNPYIFGARASLLRKALDAKCDVVVFIDHDMSWEPDGLKRLIETPDEVAAGTYRFKYPDKDEYMGKFFSSNSATAPIVRSDGCIKAQLVPAGFLKVTRSAVGRLMRAYPELVYGDPCAPHIDLFNHGAHNGGWWGEDYAFCRRWLACGGDIWVLPDLNLDHHGEYIEFDQMIPAVWKGNFWKWMERKAAKDETPHPPVRKFESLRVITGDLIVTADDLKSAA